MFAKFPGYEKICFSVDNSLGTSEPLCISSATDDSEARMRMLITLTANAAAFLFYKNIEKCVMTARFALLIPVAIPWQASSIAP